MISSASRSRWLRRKPITFQSRNRGSFDFKRTPSHHRSMSHSRFNLVIEVLLISSACPNDEIDSCRSSFNLVIEVLLISSLSISMTPPCEKSNAFQSRNRGSFDFKQAEVQVQVQVASGFNLVIEVLLISSSLEKITRGNP